MEPFGIQLCWIFGLGDDLLLIWLLRLMLMRLQPSPSVFWHGISVCEDQVPVVCVCACVRVFLCVR